MPSWLEEWRGGRSSHSDETAFLSWYRPRAQRLGLDLDPYSPEHHYDYYAAFKAGAEPDETGHWPSVYKSPDHPNRFVDGVDTISGKPSAPSWLDEFKGASDAMARYRAKLAGEEPPEDSEEMRRAKTRKRVEILNLGAANPLLSDDQTEEAIKRRTQIEPGLRVNPEAFPVGQRQAAEIGIDESRRNWVDTALGAAELYGREVADFPAAIVRTQEDLYDALQRVGRGAQPDPVTGKAPDPTVGAMAARALSEGNPLFYGVRAHRAMGDPLGALGFARENPEARDEAMAKTVVSAPNAAVGDWLARYSMAAGMVTDPIAAGVGIYNRLGARGAEAAAAAAAKSAAKAAAKPPVEMTSRMLSKEGGLPKDVWQTLQTSKRAGEGADFDAAAAINKVDREIQSELDTALALETPDRKLELNRLIDSALTSGDPRAMEALPARLQRPVSEIRARMDQESHQIVRNALFSDEAAEALRSVVQGVGDPGSISGFFRDRQAVKAGMRAAEKVGIDPNFLLSRSHEGFDASLASIRNQELRTTLRDARTALWRTQEFAESLAPEARGALEGLGRHLDSLSPQRRAVADHYLPVLTKIEGNLGKYLRTSYQAFDNPQWARVLSENEQAEAFQGLVKYATDFDGKAPDEAKRWGKTILSEIEQNAAANGARASLFPEFPEAVKSALLRKKDIPEPLQEFLGINRDWRVGFQRGMVAAAEIGNEIQQWDDLMQSAGGKLFAMGPDGAGAVNAAGQDLTYKVTKGSRFLAPEGQAIYTTPEIGQILDGASALVREGTPLYRWQMANSLARFGWTVANIPTHAVNVMGDIVLSVKAGDIRSPLAFAREFKHAVGSEFARIAGKTPPAESRELDAFRSAVAKRGGMTTGGAIAEERRHLGSLLGVPSKGIRGKLTPGPEEALGVATPKTEIVNALKRVTGKGMDYAASFFTAPDQAVRLSHIEAKANQLAKAYPGRSSDAIMDEAVERGLNEIPSPEYGPKAIQKLRENFAFGSLITYPTEILRTTWNSFEYAAKDLHKALTATDAQLAAEGADRAGLMEMGIRGTAGTVAAMALVPTVAASAKMALSKVWPDANDPEKIEAMKRFMPSYYKDANLMALGDASKNNVVFMDWSPVDAFGQMGRAATSTLAAIRDGEDAFGAALAGANSMVEPYTGMQPLAQAGVEALTNRKEGGSGAPITNPEASLGQRAGDYGYHFLKTLGPGTPVKTPLRFLEAGQSGDDWVAAREIASWFGIRMYRFDKDKQIERTARDRQKAYVNLMQLRNQAVKKDFLTAGSPAVLEAESEAQGKWVAEMVPELQKDIEAAKRLGKSDAEIVRLFSGEGGLPKKHILALLRGETLPLSWKD